MSSPNEDFPTEQTIYYVEMYSPDELRPPQRGNTSIEVRRQEPPDPKLNKFLYENVGRDWCWIDLFPWSDADWLEYAASPNVQTWVAYQERDIAGYFELRSEPNGSVEIVQFGLMPSFVGQGLGGQMLVAAVNRAWETGASRVWLHTCSLDHPHALDNYKARGFMLFKVETAPVELPKQ